MARKARRGLADLSDSEEEDCVHGKMHGACSSKENVISLFETKVFSDNVLSKIREEEAKVTSSDGLRSMTVRIL